jgi:hypothetical protein
MDNSLRALEFTGISVIDIRTLVVPIALKEKARILG